MKNSQSNLWFKKVRGSYLPISPTGYAIYLLYVAYLVALIVGWFFEGYKPWTLLTEIVPLFAGVATLTQHIASKHAVK